MGSKKRVCEKCGEEFVLAPDKPGYTNLCPQCSGPPPLSNEDPKKISGRKHMIELAREFGWSGSEIENMVDDQWLEDHGIEPTNQDSK